MQIGGLVTNIEVINAGVLDTLKGLLGIVTKSLTSFTKAGIQLGKISEDRGVYKVPLKFKNGQIFQLKYKYLDPNKTKCKMMIVDDDGEQVTNPSVAINNNPKNFEKAVYELLKKGWDIDPEEFKDSDAEFEESPDRTEESAKLLEDGSDSSSADDADVIEVDFEEVPASRKLKATLQRIACSDGDTINLVSVYGNYSPEQMNADISTVFNDAAVIDTVSDTPTTFLITDSDNEFDVTRCNENPAECHRVTLVNLLSSAYSALHTFQVIRWNAKGESFNLIRSSSDDFIWRLRTQIDALAELCVELTGSVPHIPILVNCTDSLDTSEGFSGDSGLKLIATTANNYIFCLEFYVNNFDEDIQTMINSWIREMKHMSNYEFKRMCDSSALFS